MGLDFSLGQLKRLRDKIDLKTTNIYLVLGDARKLPFRNEVFNAVTCSGALSEITDKKQVIGETGRVLKPHGKIAIMTMNKEEIPLLHSWAYNAKTLKNDLKVCGLKKIRVIILKPMYLIAIARKHS